MEKLRDWEELCRLRLAAQWEEDSACMALTAKFVARLPASLSDLDRWRRARERSTDVHERMRRHATAAAIVEPAAAPRTLVPAATTRIDCVLEVEQHRPGGTGGPLFELPGDVCPH